uniref:ZM domain-containing protein n=1 Tax=Caenorhabditis tropicalis TaxID=1561998 RepID=A0A1I7UJW2_9PELO
MAYVESFYLEPENLAPVENTQTEEIIQQEPESDVTIKASPVSDYCGFESDEIPPIYRAQLRAAQKSKILAAENAEKSMYAYATETENKQRMKQDNIEPDDSHFAKYYVPGFSPPSNDSGEILKRSDFSLPKHHGVEATENVFNVAGKHEASQYIPMEHEDVQILNTPRKSEMESLISYTADGGSQFETMSSTIGTSSCVTATLGPAFGCLPSSRSGGRLSEDKYKGLSAFRPVTKYVESQYADVQLN